MSDYTPEHVSKVADDLEDLVGVVRAATAVEMLRAYAATLRQQGGRSDVTDEAVLALDAYLWRKHGVCLGKAAMRAALEAVWPKSALAQNTQGEAEPVAWMRESGAPAGSETSVITKVIRDLWLQCNPLLVERYTIPLYLHAARATVPDEMTQQVFREDDPERFGYVRGFNVCRDLVLAAATPSQPEDAA